ncbi:DUF6504 family protein [Alicyclobacillus macrosporangiidus]|uniref:DUF6504 domain-containing protein n=1 Tax=Alicyclobacillus macrosporangiidus TaxID=392015 RepID=A0A1I7L262_9BACL|nr:DUF6504 family protein [Alicyclobacillus macrosporangiidus]SFV03767.1 hypothetical protein SAMN05421543_12333 [Alicyclobacillus macrosporangiidus]
MTRLVHRPIIVTETMPDTGAPAVFIDRGHKHVVKTVLDRWIESGKWWEGERYRTVYRVMTDTLAIYELELQGGKWTLYRVYD